MRRAGRHDDGFGPRGGRGRQRAARPAAATIRRCAMRSRACSTDADARRRSAPARRRTRAAPSRGRGRGRTDRRRVATRGGRRMSDRDVGRRRDHQLQRRRRGHRLPASVVASRAPAEIVVSTTRRRTAATARSQRRSRTCDLVRNDAQPRLRRRGEPGRPRDDGAVRLRCQPGCDRDGRARSTRSSAALDAHPRAGAVGALVLNPDGSVQPTKRAFPSFGQAVLHGIVGIFRPDNPGTRAYMLTRRRLHGRSHGRLGRRYGDGGPPRGVRRGRRVRRGVLLLRRGRRSVQAILRTPGWEVWFEPGRPW